MKAKLTIKIPQGYHRVKGTPVIVQHGDMYLSLQQKNFLEFVEDTWIGHSYHQRDGNMFYIRKDK